MMLIGLAAGVVGGIVAWKLLSARTRQPPPAPEPPPEEILKQRYARGEIDEVELDRRMKTLHPT